ncbi:MAG: demethoxyubiquinone hydroxylase family protein [Candidatus Pelagibacterales bacterium]|mgnify:FL=1|jgi:ubiquinone biosynthesis monooxygenase Coq7|tara:strand:+ start:2385 stop:2912 length:528 start_codon:yes stop_codon:yes gene_type:complete
MNEKNKLIDKIIRVNQAGEIGAQRIYDAQRKVLKFLGKHDDVIKISQMAEDEQEHLDFFNAEIKRHNVRPTLLGPVWEFGATAIGISTAIMGPKAAYACTEAVEEVIVEHYQKQIDMLEGVEPELQAKIKKFQKDEEGHKQAAINMGSHQAIGYSVLRKFIRKTTQTAVYLAEKI